MKKYRTESEWLSLIQDQERSGQSISKFSRDKSIHPNLFYKKRKEFSSTSGKSSFVELKTSSVQCKPKIDTALKITIGKIEIVPGSERDREFIGALIKTAWEVSRASF